MEFLGVLPKGNFTPSLVEEIVLPFLPPFNHTFDRNPRAINDLNFAKAI